MSPIVFGVAFAVGAMALAVWTDVRFARLAPVQLRGILLHAFAAFLVLHLVAGVVGPLMAAGYGTAVLTVVFVALPAIAYAFLTGIWMIRMFHGAYAGSR
jgi:hypothetical protein